ncbi:MAG: AAA family ATPase [Bacteroidetes bacterium RIFCSPLOWO2_12_FULL_35_15]|nr:MAG: AAA family ATPase [Bacteroidetes bacterium RIFCSPLOWO2_12_FULL_35_15]
MNQDLLIRLFKSIEGEKNDDIIKVAQKIIDDETIKGHSKLADRLKNILDKNISSHETFHKELKTLLPNGAFIPTDKRNNIPLATPINQHDLRHEMILPVEVENKIRRIEGEFTARERLALFGLKPKKKVLLYGSPGCGKSMSAERIAWTIGLPFLKVRLDAIISSYLGESASNLKKLFDSLNNYPCVLLLDEFDYIAKTRSNGQDVGEMHRIVNILLNLLEDYDAPGILIATTNIEGTIDKAIFRRFDDIIEIPKPGKEEIIRLLKTTISTIEIDKKVKFSSIATKLENYSAALIVKVAQDAAKFSVIQNRKIVSQEDLEKAVEENRLYNSK